MDRKQLKWRLKYTMQYFPFTLNTVICVAGAWVAYHLLYRPVPVNGEPSPFLPFVVLMGKLAFWFTVALVSFSLLSTFAGFLYYRLLRLRKGYTMKVKFETETRNGKRARVYMTADLPGAFRPFLGFVKGRLFYDNNVLTPQFALLTDRRRERSLRREAISGKSRLWLPDIKEYELKGGFVYFQDMLHIFSLAVSQPVSGHFYQPPEHTGVYDTEVYPKKTETMDVRIDQLRRVDGELLNYKNFESGDDVRRIVWKVYARNRELVVRVPELFEPYASHLHYYASFYAAVRNTWLAGDYMREMLNYYKNCVWTIYDTLSKKEWDMRFIPDQQLVVAEDMPEEERVARIVTNASWQTDTPTGSYFKPTTGAVLVISSFTEADDLAQLLERCNSSTVVYFVKVSGVLRSLAPLRWVSRILFQPPQDRLSRLRARWPFSPLRYQLAKREKALEALLEKSSVSWGVI